MNVANELAAAGAAAPEQVARIIFKGIFENGPGRLSANDRMIAIGVISVALTVWKRHLIAAVGTEEEKYKKLYQDAKAELDDVRLKLAIFQKEQ